MGPTTTDRAKISHITENRLTGRMRRFEAAIKTFKRRPGFKE
jgi:hypothetical protein